MCCFFFFKQKTAYEMRISDWSSDVCSSDLLWFCGDLVNRGGESLETLRLIKSLSDISTVVLGNHDLALLSIAERTPEEQNKVNVDLRRVLQAPDSRELIDWLRQIGRAHV